MKKYKNYTLQEYVTSLSQRKPVPGGGSAAALTAACGVALISMVANYSKGRGNGKRVENKINSIFKQSERIRTRLVELIDLDVQAYQAVVDARAASSAVKKRALRRAAKVPDEVSRLCYKAAQLASYLVEKGNPNLVSDIVVASDLLLAAFSSARVNVEVNQ